MGFYKQQKKFSFTVQEAESLKSVLLKLRCQGVTLSKILERICCMPLAASGDYQNILACDPITPVFRAHTFKSPPALESLLCVCLKGRCKSPSAFLLKGYMCLCFRPTQINSFWLRS